MFQMSLGAINTGHGGGETPGTPSTGSGYQSPFSTTFNRAYYGGSGTYVPTGPYSPPPPMPPGVVMPPTMPPPLPTPPQPPMPDPLPPPPVGTPTGSPTDTPTAGTTVTIDPAYPPEAYYPVGFLSPTVKRGILWGLGIAAVIGAVVLWRKRA